MQTTRRLWFIRSALIASALAAAPACDSDPGHAGRTSRQWISSLKSGSETDKSEAAQALGKILEIRPDYPEVVTALVAALRDTSDVVRIAAASALTAEGVDTKAAIDGLHEVLHDTAHADVRTSAVLIISALGPERAGALLSYLCELLDDPSPKVRAAAVEAIGQLGAAAVPEIPAISRMLRDSAADVRQAVLQALVNLGAGSRTLVPAARAALSDSSSTVRASAADALRSLGSTAAPAVGDLSASLGDPDERVVRGAIVALGAIGPAARSALPSLRRLDANRRGGERALTQTIAILEGRAVAGQGSSEPTVQDRCRNNPQLTGC